MLLEKPALDNTPLDIAFFCDARSVHYQKWTNALRERGYNLEIYSPWPGNIPNHQVYATPKAPFTLPTGIKTLGKVMLRARNGKRIRAELMTKPPRLVHAHYLLDAGWMAAQLQMHPFLVTVHGSDLLVHPAKSRIYEFVSRTVLSRCDRVIIVGEHLRDKLAKYHVPETKIRLVPSFVDTATFFPRAQNRTVEKLVIGSARNFEPIYNVETLIKAFQIVLGNFPNAELCLVGDGSQKDSLIALARMLDVSGRVKFLGRLNQYQIADFFRNIDIYVSTALSDGISVTLLEAAASGAFPVVAGIEGNFAAFQYGLQGAFFEPGDEQALANRLLEVASKRPSIKRVSSYNRSVIETVFNKETVVEQMIAVYQELLN